MALGELGWMAASEAQVLYYHLSRHVRRLCFLIIFYMYLCIIALQLKTEKLEFRVLLWIIIKRRPFMLFIISYRFTSLSLSLSLCVSLSLSVSISRPQKTAVGSPSFNSVTLWHHYITESDICIMEWVMASLSCKNLFSKAALLLLAVLAQACASWPIRADWWFSSGVALKRQKLK